MSYTEVILCTFRVTSFFFYIKKHYKIFFHLFVILKCSYVLFSSIFVLSRNTTYYFFVIFLRLKCSYVLFSSIFFLIKKHDMKYGIKQFLFHYLNLYTCSQYFANLTNISVIKIVLPLSHDLLV